LSYVNKLPCALQFVPRKQFLINTHCTPEMERASFLTASVQGFSGHSLIGNVLFIYMVNSTT